MPMQPYEAYITYFPTHTRTHRERDGMGWDLFASHDEYVCVIGGSNLYGRCIRYLLPTLSSVGNIRRNEQVRGGKFGSRRQHIYGT
ncbi:hypothetical protein F4774DRAFT_370041 [Daldinia eschscholtzii]|nr:hypothetical protein F4774DRAFT_370041 [Daldinia eschscholtzii]